MTDRPKERVARELDVLRDATASMNADGLLTDETWAALKDSCADRILEALRSGGEERGYNLTDRVRRVLGLADVERDTLGHAYLGTEHVVLGLLAEGESVGCAVLHQLDCLPELTDARRVVLKTVGGKGPCPTCSGVGFVSEFTGDETSMNATSVACPDCRPATEPGVSGEERDGEWHNSERFREDFPHVCDAMDGLISKAQELGDVPLHCRVHEVSKRMAGLMLCLRDARRTPSTETDAPGEGELEMIVMPTKGALRDMMDSYGGSPGGTIVDHLYECLRKRSRPEPTEGPHHCTNPDCDWTWYTADIVTCLECGADKAGPEPTVEGEEGAWVLPDGLETLALDLEESPYIEPVDAENIGRMLREAARRLRERPEGERVEGYVYGSELERWNAGEIDQMWVARYRGMEGRKRRVIIHEPTREEG